MVFGSLVLDDKAHEVRIDDKLVTLTPKEYDLLKCFLMNHHIALSREQLLTNIWGYDFYGDDRTVDTHVKTLRQHLGKYGKYVKTIRKVGINLNTKTKKQSFHQKPLFILLPLVLPFYYYYGYFKFSILNMRIKIIKFKI